MCGEDGGEPHSLLLHSGQNLLRLYWIHYCRLLKSGI
jgi:hypothetical protein